ncbi:hypothetical protein FNF27_01340 [Cafeteria roenbergensis]|uniref:Uncharacterized protein n=2 Tax=Cafeteria roenbergensis TaxID=33653 RepID=A0A5A8C988_CAFRO|nr:hypothetical protein FNF29_05864 [Cafeteria roenbergensis]KAA0164007.1 hypothetical protein FNF31_02556 [Cafeteria roenbergensis]KAA0177010.1 hypothetical protein FNF27_01340 [Cafeteria roenbergensis]|eukprot:KAA0149653.1 hypothetical protein FNF29_05864 [Cafeteria roenbergensis]
MASTQNPKEGAELRTESPTEAGHKPADSATAFMAEPAAAAPAKKEAGIEPWKGISAVEMFWTLFSGLWFGFALQKAGVGNADVIRDQFTFKQNTMLVMFLSASATSLLAIAAMKTASESSKQAAEKAGKKYMSSATQGLFAVGIGGCLIGAGMAVAGTCPGTIWAQLGAGQPKALITFAGALVGAAIIALIHCYIVPFLKTIAPKSRTLASVTGLHPMVAALILLAIFAAVIIVVLVVPGAYKPLPGAADVFGYPYWHPIVGGVMVGLTQIPLTLGVGKNLGASTSFSVIVSNAFQLVGFNNDYTRPLIGGTSWWNVLFVVFATGGAALSALSGNSWYAYDAMAVTEVEAFFGGILLLLGARLASGCTSGHGITGVGHGSLISIVGVAGIFAGGMVVAFPAYNN